MEKDDIVGRIIDIASKPNVYISEDYEVLLKRYDNTVKSVENDNKFAVDKVIECLKENYNARKVIE